jgi:hypothetical protein
MYTNIQLPTDRKYFTGVGLDDGGGPGLGVAALSTAQEKKAGKI